MTLNEYQTNAHTFATYPEMYAKEYLSLGIIGESGEVCDKVKKLIRDKGIFPFSEQEELKISHEDRVGIINELGDVCWYISEFCYNDNTALGKFAHGNAQDEIQDDIPYEETFNIYNLSKSLSLGINNLVADNKFHLLNDEVLPVVAAIANRLNYTLDEVLVMNLDKLTSRKERGVLNGSGDNR